MDSPQMTEREAQERVAFEEWAKDYVKGMDSRGAYTSPYTMIAWQAWQASAARAALSTTPDVGGEPVANATLKEVAARMAANLYDIADTCDAWARESREGGWSTHQVAANQRLANDCLRWSAQMRSALQACEAGGSTTSPKGKEP